VDQSWIRGSGELCAPTACVAWGAQKDKTRCAPPGAATATIRTAAWNAAHLRARRISKRVTAAARVPLRPCGKKCNIADTLQAYPSGRGRKHRLEGSRCMVRCVSAYNCVRQAGARSQGCAKHSRSNVLASMAQVADVAGADAFLSLHSCTACKRIRAVLCCHEHRSAQKGRATGSAGRIAPEKSRPAHDTGLVAARLSMMPFKS